MVRGQRVLGAAAVVIEIGVAKVVMVVITIVITVVGMVWMMRRGGVVG